MCLGRIRNDCQHNSNFNKIMTCISVGLVAVSIGGCCILITAEFSKAPAEHYCKEMYVFLYVLSSMIVLCGLQMCVCACCHYARGTYPLDRHMSVAPPFTPAYISRTPYSTMSSSSGVSGEHNISYYVDTTDVDTVDL